MSKYDEYSLADVGLLALRATVGGLLAGHGAQKLFGSFGGPGIEGTTGIMNHLGMQPAKPWAVMAGASEFGSGALMALGLLGPIGPISAYGPMIMAWAKAHAGKPIWVTSGGAELPLINMTVAAALALLGPGRISLDDLLDLEVPPALIGLTAAGVAAGLVLGLRPTASAPASQASSADEQVSVVEHHAASSPSREHAPTQITDASDVSPNQGSDSSAPAADDDQQTAETGQGVDSELPDITSTETPAVDIDQQTAETGQGVDSELSDSTNTDTSSAESDEDTTAETGQGVDSDLPDITSTDTPSAESDEDKTAETGQGVDSEFPDRQL